MYNELLIIRNIVKIIQKRNKKNMNVLKEKKQEQNIFCKMKKAGRKLLC